MPTGNIGRLCTQSALNFKVWEERQEWENFLEGTDLEILSKRPQGAEKALCGETVVQKGVFGESVFFFAPLIRSEKLQKESSPNFSNFRPEFCPEFC